MNTQTSHSKVKHNLCISPCREERRQGKWDFTKLVYFRCECHFFFIGFTLFTIQEFSSRQSLSSIHYFEMRFRIFCVLAQCILYQEQDPKLGRDQRGVSMTIHQLGLINANFNPTYIYISYCSNYKCYSFSW